MQNSIDTQLVALCSFKRITNDVGALFIQTYHERRCTFLIRKVQRIKQSNAPS